MALKTFPAPDAALERMRILAYTCEGGYDGPRLEGKTTYLDMTARRLLARGMSFGPDAVPVYSGAGTSRAAMALTLALPEGRITAARLAMREKGN